MSTITLYKLTIFLLSVNLVSAENIVDEMNTIFTQDSGNCSLINTIPLIDQCSYILSQCNDEISGYFNYLAMYYCRFQFLGSFSILPLLACLVFLFVWLGLTASEYLCPNLYTISKAMNLSENLAGLTLLALGNASPDVLGTFQAMNLGYGNLAISELMGSALFITTVVIGSMALVKPFSVPKESFIRDVTFFLFVSILLLVSLMDSKLTFTNCLTLVVVYIIYVLYVVFEHSSKKRIIKTRLRNQRARSHYSIHERSNDQIDSIYLDSFSSLPTIDEIGLDRSSHISEESHRGNTSKHDTYDLDLLIRELDYNDTPHGKIRLENERELTLSLEGNNMNGEIEEAVIGDFSNINDNDDGQIYHGGIIESEISNYSYESIRIGIFKVFNDKLDFSKFLELEFFNQIYFIISFVALLILNLTNPVVEHSVISDLKCKLNAPISITPISSESESETIEFEEDSTKTCIQLFFGLNFVVYMIFGDLNSYYLISFPLGLVITSIVSYNIRSLYDYNSYTKLYVYYFVSFVGFLVSTSWIATLATEIIGVLKAISTIYNLSQEILGVTVFALGNCVGDFISNITVAKMGVPVMAIGACFGGPLLAISSIGISGLIIIKNQYLINGFTVEFSRTNSITCFLLIANIIFLLISVPRNNWMIDRKIGTILICNWLFATTLSIISEFN